MFPLLNFLLNELLSDRSILTMIKRLSGRFVFGPQDMEELLEKKDEIVEKDLLKLRLVV